tara:strand:- start:504 stop:1406 length:903 start_codon:yes stop_codon:yes gene_type:complete
MSISRQNLSVVIVTLKSENVIHQCIKSIDKNLPIIVVENSNDSKFKDDLENKYSNVKCTLTNENLGMGSGNNIGIKLSLTDYVLIINPDVILENNTIDSLIEASKNISDFVIMSPILDNLNYPNYELINKNEIDNNKGILKVKNVDGFALIVNKKKIEKILNSSSKTNETIYFDENFFMYLENIDLCKRVIEGGGNIFVATKSKIKHLGGKAVDDKFNNEIEISRNWHWIWSKFYYNKKHYGFLKAFINGFPTYCSSITKYLFYLLTNNNFKKKIYFGRASGFFNALIGKKSWYRPNLEN